MKFNNYGFWTSIAAGAVFVVGAVQKILGVEIEAKILADIIMGIAGVLVVFGVVKMPKENQAEIDEEIEQEDEKDKE